MADPILDRDALEESLRLVAEEATRYLAHLDAAPVRPPGPGEPAELLAGALPDDGAGSLAALRALIDAAWDGATRSAGPRFFAAGADVRRGRDRPVGRRCAGS